MNRKDNFDIAWLWAVRSIEGLWCEKDACLYRIWCTRKQSNDPHGKKTQPTKKRLPVKHRVMDYSTYTTYCHAPSVQQHHANSFKGTNISRGFFNLLYNFKHVGWHSLLINLLHLAAKLTGHSSVFYSFSVFGPLITNWLGKFVLKGVLAPNYINTCNSYDGTITNYWYAFHSEPFFVSCHFLHAWSRINTIIKAIKVYPMFSKKTYNNYSIAMFYLHSKELMLNI